ncbi:MULTISPECIES: nitrogen regulation protein NR(II) [unclassified Duganella]|uniref:two-component system sensor histidine kinase NtrB n=1 Tax=unclassified Duganella TaxID=2636909 RepID=UPI00087E9000|nr:MULTISPECIES: PAS domain S-box protein [unclassified Duganella]SDF91608.1 two-component system, LuxR family, sensor histidine kinase DctS [Duganella sp. OV458]SDJ13508.1 PAS/PAC sensor signal transduction histidine kinase [Duganella sp. OV510]
MTTEPTQAPAPRRRPLSNTSLRWLLPIMLVLFFLAILIWLPWQARQMESNERQEQLIADTLWVEQTIRFQMARDEESLRSLGVEISAGNLNTRQLHERMARLLKNGQELVRVVWLKPNGELAATSDPLANPVELSPASRETADITRKTHRPMYTQPEAQTQVANAAPSAVLMDYHVPLFRGDEYLGDLMATFQTSALLDEMVPWWFAQDNQVSLVDRDDKVLARRAAAGPGHGVYTHKRALDLPGASVMLVTDSVKSEPKLLPNLLVGSVIVLSLGLLWSLLALWGHISKRLAAEGALRQQMLFRTAMENSLVTGLRARDLEGRITYVNPAFCQIVGYPAEEIVGKLPPMPYWATEAMSEYEARFASVLAGKVTPQFETFFQRPNGDRVPVLVFEAPLVDNNGKQTGWMGSILDISDRKRIEEVNRQQQEKLQASARLATMGEIASMLAHELNQPLAAISSYTTGALNVLDRDGPLDRSILKPALEQASTQAQRAGQIIRSVHEFVKKREPLRQAVAIASLLDGIRALIELQARQSYVSYRTEIPPDLPPVRADRVMIEQVLLNLTRNGIEAMQHVQPQRRILKVVADYDAVTAQVSVAVIDQGHGIPEEVAARLFSPFFSTKAEGMGMGLNICRTAIEFHGGALTFRANPQGGTIFTFVLPAATEQETS